MEWMNGLKYVPLVDTPIKLVSLVMVIIGTVVIYALKDRFRIGPKSLNFFIAVMAVVALSIVGSQFHKDTIQGEIAKAELAAEAASAALAASAATALAKTSLAASATTPTSIVASGVPQSSPGASTPIDSENDSSSGATYYTADPGDLATVHLFNPRDKADLKYDASETIVAPSNISGKGSKPIDLKAKGPSSAKCSPTYLPENAKITRVAITIEQGRKRCGSGFECFLSLPRPDNRVCWLYQTPNHDDQHDQRPLKSTLIVQYEVSH